METTISYKLRRIKSSKHPDFIRCLNLYSQNIEPLVRTNTNDISYWLDNFEKRQNENFFLFGFYINNLLVGYAQMVSFIDDGVLFIDYLVIEKRYRRNNTYFEFIERISIFFKDQPTFKYVLAEVALFKINNQPCEDAKKLIRLFKISGFNILKVQYMSPMLGKDNYESEMECALMIFVPNSLIDRIKRDTFISIIKVIYFKHYQKWYAELIGEKGMIQYNNSLYKLFNDIEYKTAKRIFIEINGFSNLFSQIPPQIPIVQKSKWKQLFLLTGTIALTTIVLGSMYLLIRNKIGIEFSALSIIVLASSVISVIILGLFHKDGEEDLLKIIKSLLGKN